ncbi:MAG: hypothetical protein ACRDBY_15090 [Cetobacterium sp.]
MKKKFIILAITSISTGVLASECLTKDMRTLTENVKIAKKLKKSNSSMDKIALKNKTVNIIKEIDHIKTKHNSSLSKKEKIELAQYTTEFIK